MSLRSRVQKATDRTFRRLDSLAVDAVYIQKGETSLSSYDPATGQLTVTEEQTNLRVILSSVSDKEMDHSGGVLKPSDRKALFSRTGFPYVPDVEDVLRISPGPPDAGDWEVVMVFPESSESSVVLAIRRR